MPRLLLLRHSKAERPAAGQEDHDRELSKRGRKDAADIGRKLAERGEQPTAMLCSTSERTRQTWEIVRNSLREPPEPVFLGDIFGAGGDYIDILRREGRDAGSLLLIGHNPAIHASAVLLAESFEAEGGEELTRGYPTSAVAILEFDGAWSDLRPGAMRLAAFLRPDAD